MYINSWNVHVKRCCVFVHLELNQSFINSQASQPCFTMSNVLYKNGLLGFCRLFLLDKKRRHCLLSIYGKLLLPCQLARTPCQNSFQLPCSRKRPCSEGAWNRAVSGFGPRSPFLKEEQKEAASAPTHESVHGPKRDMITNTQFPFAKLTLPI